VTTAGHCWPTSAQQLLLRAALVPGPETLAAWQRSAPEASLDTLDAGSIRLLPLLYRSLERLGVHDPVMGRLKGVYRHAWYGNQLRLRDAAPVLAELRGRGIAAMLLKGAALTLGYYRDVGLRPMDDVDVLVRADQARPAADALHALGWRPAVPVTARRVAASHAVEFADARGQRIDLHWHLSPDACWPGIDDAFWGRARATALHGVGVAVLDPTDQLFHTCAHGVRWEPVSPVRWVADAAVILREASADIDWDRLVGLAERLRLVLPARDALAYLARTLGLAVPPGVLDALRGAAVSRTERWEYRMRTRPSSPVLGRLPEHWLRYRRLRRARGSADRITFVAYLEIALGCQGVGALVHRAVFRHRWRQGAERGARARERLDRIHLP